VIADQQGTPQGTLTYTYDLVGNPLTLRSSNAKRRQRQLAYDAIQSLQSLTDNRLTPGTTPQLDAVKQSDRSIVSERRAITPATTRWTIRPTDHQQGGVLRSYAYTYNAAGQRLSRY